jgi:hypothetical protein
MTNKEMPWGDYGDALCYGYLNEMDEKFLNVIEIPELERTGPYIPPLYVANDVNILAIESVKNILQNSNMKGIKKCVKVIKKQIVEIKWQEWLGDDEPNFYPESGEPEDYIWGRKHNEELAKSMPEVFYFEIEKRHSLKQISDTVDCDHCTNFALEISLEEEGDLDIFCPLNKLYIVVSEKFKILMEQIGIDTIKFIHLKVLNI